MKQRAAMLLALSLASAVSLADSVGGVDAYRWLEGEWRGVGEGRPGRSASERRIESLLGSKYLRVQGRSVYPRQDANPGGEIHEEMDVWSFDRARDALVIRQFDNLGFVSTYVLDREASSEQRIVLNAEHLENVPKGWRARYTYVFVSPDEYHETLELDPDGSGFSTYVSNRFLRVK